MTSEEANTNLETVFLDNVEMVLDAKFRVGIPERFMKVLKTISPDCNDRIGVVPMADSSLKLLPYPEFMKTVEKWKGLDDRIQTHRTILAASKMATVAGLDSQNRIRLTPMQIRHARIKREVLIVGGINYMQIYDAGVFEEMMAREMQQFAAAEEKVALEETAPVTPIQQYVIEAHPKEMA